MRVLNHLATVPCDSLRRQRGVRKIQGNMQPAHVVQRLHVVGWVVALLAAGRAKVRSNSISHRSPCVSIKAIGYSSRIGKLRIWLVPVRPSFHFASKRALVPCNGALPPAEIVGYVDRQNRIVASSYRLIQAPDPNIGNENGHLPGNAPFHPAFSLSPSSLTVAAFSGFPATLTFSPGSVVWS